MIVKDFFKVMATMFFAYVVLISLAAEATLNSFSYDGRLYDNFGNPLNSNNVTFRLEIYSQSGACLLYQETHSAQNLSSVLAYEQGVFSLKVGSGVRGGSDPGLTFVDVFKNSGLLTGYMGCSYNPTATDIRHLRVYVDNGSGYEVLSPDLDLLSAPGTMVAQTLQGKAASEFVQVLGSVNQANLSTLVGNVDASSLHHHDSRYVQLGSSSSQNLGSGILSTTGQVGIGTNTPSAGVELHVRDTASVATVKLEGAATSGSKIIFNDAATERAAINTEGGTAALVISTGGVTALRIDADQNSSFTGSLVVAGIIRPGQLTTAPSEAAINTELTNCGAGCSGGTWYRSDTGQYRIWDHTKGIRTFAVYEGTPNTNDILTWDGSRWLPAAVGTNDPTKLPLAGGTITGQLTISGGLSASAIGTSSIAATTINATTVVANNLTVSMAPAAAQDVVNKNYADSFLASRSIANPSTGENGKSIRWNNGSSAWEYFLSLSAGSAATEVLANQDIPSCLSTEKLQMSAGPVYSYTCEPDNVTDPTKLSLGGGTITGMLEVTGAVTISGALNSGPITTSTVVANAITVSMTPSTNLDVTNKVYVDTHVGSRSLVAPSAGNDGQSLRWNNATSTWEYFTAGAAGSGVVTFNSRSGAVMPAANDYTWAQVDKTTSSLADLSTRSAGDLNSGTLSVARLPATVVLTNSSPSASEDGQSLRWNNTSSNWEYFTAGAAGSGVTTFNGRSGAVVPATNDYTWAQVDKSASSLADLNTRSASDLNTGTLSAARLPPNIFFKDAANVISVGNQVIANNINTNRPLTIRGAGGQNVALTEWQNSASIVYYSLHQSGTPTTATDLAHKNYVDNMVAGRTIASIPGAGQNGMSLRWNNTLGNWEYFTAALGYTAVNKAGDTMTGVLTLSGNPTQALEAATKQYADSKEPLLGFVPMNKAGDSMSGKLTLSGSPVNAMEAATKDYVDKFLLGQTLPVQPSGAQDGQALRWDHTSRNWVYYTPMLGSVTLGGDLIGPINAATVVKLQGRNVSNTNPTDGDYLKYSSGNWVPTSLTLSTGSIGTAEIADGTIQSTDITDGTITSADIADGSVTSADILDGTITSADVGSITISKISGTGSMCTQNGSNVNITGGMIGGINSLNVGSNGAGDIVTIATTHNTGGGILMEATGATADAYLDLRDGSATTGSIRMSLGVMRIFNQGVAGTNTLELSAGGSTPTTRMELMPTTNQAHFNGAQLTGVNNILANVITVEGGTAGAGLPGRDIKLIAEAGGAGNFSGGNVVINPGMPSGTGQPGKVQVNGPVTLGAVSLPTFVTTTPCAVGNACLSHNNGGSIFKLTTAFGSSTLACITAGVSDGQVLYVFLTNTSGTLAFTGVGSCGAGYAALKFNGTITSIGAGQFRHLHLIYDSANVLWRVISAN